MEKNIEFGDKCLDHENHTVQFVCLNITCSKVALGCVICFKNNHRSCNTSLILDRALLDRLLEVRPAENLDDLKQTIKECLEKDFNNLKQILQKKKEMIMLQFQPFEEDVSKLSPDQIIAYKKYSDIKIRNDGKIEFTNRIKSSDQIEQDLERFQKLIRQKLDLHLKIYRNLKFQNYKKLYKEDFLCHQQIQLTEKFNGLIVKKKDTNQNGQCIIMKEPVEDISFKLTFFKHQRNMSSIKFGVMDQNDYQKYSNKLQNLNVKGDGIFGTEQVKYLANYNQSNNEVQQNLDEINNLVLYISYKARTQVFTVKTGDGKLNHQKKLNSEHNHYFYLCLQEKNQQVYLQKY